MNSINQNNAKDKKDENDALKYISKFISKETPKHTNQSFSLQDFMNTGINTKR